MPPEEDVSTPPWGWYNPQFTWKTLEKEDWK